MIFQLQNVADVIFAKLFEQFPLILLKGTLSGLRQFLATETPLKIMKTLFLSP